MSGAVAIIAGEGALPGHLAAALAASGRTAVVAETERAPAEVHAALPRIRYRAERLGALFGALRDHDVREVVFAGAIQRPRLDPTRFDLKTLRLAPRVLAAIRGGDDGLLRVVAGIFEAEGFRVRAAHELAPDLLPAPGIPTRARPDDQDRKDAARAAEIVAALAAADIGQGAVVAQGVALAVEAAPGTDRMLAFVRSEAGEVRPDPQGARGVLYKGPKRGQDLRMDLPAIGPRTVEGAAAAGLAGIVIRAGGVMVLDPARTIAAADATGLFIWVRPEEPAP